MFDCKTLNLQSFDKCTEMVFLRSSDFIRCEFEEDFCHWTVHASQETPAFSWTRQTADSILGQEIDGPRSDHDGKSDKFFAFVSGTSQREVASGTTLMFSPDFISQEHPEECLEFWFYIKVISFAKQTFTAQKVHFSLFKQTS